MSAQLQREEHQQEATLNVRLAEIRSRMEGLARDLHLVDEELEAVADEKTRFDLVMQACDALQTLDELGAASLFWGEGFDAQRTQTHLRLVRGRLDAFGKQIEEIQERRDAISTALDIAQQDAELIEDELYELACQAEARKHEWVIERDLGDFPDRPVIMPWARGGEDDKRMRKALALALLLSLLLGLILPLIELPVPEAWEPVEIPERLTRLIEERKPLPPPPPKQQQLAEAKPEQKEEEKKPQAEKKTEEVKPKVTQAEKARVGSKGILAFREKFSSLSEDMATDRLGARARIRETGKVASGNVSSRSMVATKATGSSGGINVAELSRGMGAGAGGDLEGVEIGQVTSSIGDIAGEERPLSEGPGPSRTDEEIQIVFDRHKAALYRLYNRQLRKDPTLQGQIVLRLVIQPDGSVSLCEVHSSDMNAPELAEQVVARVLGFDFGAKEDVPPVKILYPIDFLPAG